MRFGHSTFDLRTARKDPLFAPPSDWGARPVIDLPPLVSAEAMETLTLELRRYGYVVAETGMRRLGELEEKMVRLGESLELGPPFVPSLYANRGIYRASGLHLIGSKKGDLDHAAFVGSAAQDLHCDGTLEPMGLVNTTMLGCVEKAHEGGSSLLFNALGGFYDLWVRDQDSAVTLLWDNCLARSASLDPGIPPTRGPAFGLVKDNYLLTRYSRTPGDRYRSTPGKEACLKQALSHLSCLAQPDSRYLRETTLSPGQILLFANSRLSHGRTAYQNDPGGRPRLFLRALFTGPPDYWLG